MRLVSTPSGAKSRASVNSLERSSGRGSSERPLHYPVYLFCNPSGVKQSRAPCLDVLPAKQHRVYLLLFGLLPTKRRVHVVLGFCIDDKGPTVDAKCSSKAGRDTAYLLSGLPVEQILVVTHSRVLVA